MACALILSSYVAASRIGGSLQMLALAALGFRPVLAPTVVLGRNPALGNPGGGAVEPERLGALLDAIEAEGVCERADLLITGYFASAAQATMAQGLIARIRRHGRAVVVIDPILGDYPKGLYVDPELVGAHRDRLDRLGDWITPNAWELERLTGIAITDAASACDAARRYGIKALVTSVPAGPGEIGLLCWDGQTAALFAHRRRETAPHGAGDLATAVFGAALAQGLAPASAALRAAAAASDAVEAALDDNELPIPTPGLGEPAARIRVEVVS